VAAAQVLPTSGEGILFLDELTSAPQMTQAGCYQLVLDRKLGEYQLPNGWVVIAAGNPASERGVHFSMQRPLRNRFVHLDLEPDFEDWSNWAVKPGIRPEIIAFLRFKPTLLHDSDATSNMNAWPTPRSWQMASCVLTGFAARQNDGFLTGTSEIEAQLLEGTIGPAATIELVAFLRLSRQLPSIPEILLNPDTAPVPMSHRRGSPSPRRSAGCSRITRSPRGCGISTGCRPSFVFWPCAMRRLAIAPSHTRRSSFASAWNMRRFCNDF
jgi:hypothetical protein